MELKAQKRVIQGKGVAKLRRQGKIPAILYGGKANPKALTLAQPEFERVYQEAGESTLVDLNVEGKKEKVLITDVQHDPLGKLLHVDLQRVEAGEKLTATVAVKVVGESPIVKSGEGILLTLLDEVEIECLPQDLPSEINIDISSLTEIGRGVTVKDLPIDQTKIKILGHEPEELVLKIDYPQMEEEEEVAPVSEEAAVAAVEAVEEKPEEAEAPGEEKEGPPSPEATEGRKEKPTPKSNRES